MKVTLADPIGQNFSQKHVAKNGVMEVGFRLHGQLQVVCKDNANVIQATRSLSDGDRKPTGCPSANATRYRTGNTVCICNELGDDCTIGDGLESNIKYIYTDSS